MRLIGILFALLFLAVAGLGVWLYIDNDSHSVSRVSLPQEVAGTRRDTGQGRHDRVPLNPVEPELLEQGPHGPLPRRVEGREPWRVYGRTYEVDEDKPRVAILIVGLGLRDVTTETAINELPPEVSLAFSPYAEDLPRHIENARRAGHEVLTVLPVEATQSELVDSGARAILTGLNEDALRDRLYWVMGRYAGYVGLVIRTPGPLMNAPGQLIPVMTELRDRGLIFVDARPISAGAMPHAARETGVVHVRATAWLDDDPTPNAIDAQMARTEGVARASGVALVVGQPYPVTLRLVQRWTAELARNDISLAPVTGLVNTRATQ